MSWATCYSGSNNIHFNVMHDPWEFSLSRIPTSAKDQVIAYLEAQQTKHVKYAKEILALKNIVASSAQSDNTDLANKLRRTDLYRNQNFAVSHSKIAQAINYEL